MKEKINKIQKMYNQYFKNRIVVDMGSHKIKIASPDRDKIIEESSIIIVNGQNVVAVGNEAQKIIGKIPKNFEIIKPIKNGQIYDFDAAELLVEYLLKSYSKDHLNKLYNPSYDVVVCIGANTTPIEERNIKDLFFKVGASNISLIPQTIAAAIGADVDLQPNICQFFLNIGCGVSEFIVLVDNNIIEKRIIKTGGDRLTKAIMETILQKEKMQISYSLAEYIKIEYGDMDRLNDDDDIIIIGQDKFMNTVKEKSIKAKLINQVIHYEFKFIFEEFLKILDKINPDIAIDLYNNGIYLFGGSSEFNGLPNFVEQLLNVKVINTANPKLLSLKGGCIYMDSDI